MKRYGKIYLKLLQLSWSSLLIYRSNFFNSIISSLVWSFFNILAIVLLTAKTSQVFGWTRGELIMLVGTSNIVLGIFYFFFSINLHELAYIINLGKLDTILTKPLDNQFSVSLWQVSYQSISRMLFGICVVTFMALQTHVHVTIINAITFVLLVVFSIILQYSMWFGVLTLTIWFSKLNNLNDLLYNTNDLGRFPPEMFRGGKEFLYFVVFPFTLVNVVPIKSLLQKATVIDIFWLLFISSFFFYLSRKFFQFALRSYTSAGG